MNVLLYNSGTQEVFDTFFTPRAKKTVDALGPVRCVTPESPNLTQALAEAEILFGLWGMPRLDQEFLRRLPRLKLICYTCGSVADYMTEAVPAAGIRLLSANKIFAGSVAEGTLGYMLLSLRKMLRQIGSMRETGWRPVTPIVNAGLKYHTIGIIGYGMIAKELLRLLQPFGVRLLVCSDWFTAEDEALWGAEKCSLEELLETSDIVTLHESLRPDTVHMLGQTEFERMRDGALFINTSRGPIIDEEALARVCGKKDLQAVLDVYETEPLPMDSPLRGRENIILFPHCGGPTIDLREHCVMALAADAAVFEADPEAVLEYEVTWEYAQHMTHEKGLLKFRK